MPILHYSIFRYRSDTKGETKWSRVFVFAAGPLSYGGVVSSMPYLAITVLVGVVVVLSTVYGIWQFETYVYPPGCTVEYIHSCGAWLWDYSAPLRTHPH